MSAIRRARTTFGSILALTAMLSLLLGAWQSAAVIGDDMHGAAVLAHPASPIQSLKDDAQPKHPCNGDTEFCSAGAVLMDVPQPRSPLDGGLVFLAGLRLALDGDRGIPLFAWEAAASVGSGMREMPRIPTGPPRRGA